MKAYITLLFGLLLFSACKKEEPEAKADLYPDAPVSTPSSSAIGVFHQPTSYYNPFIYRYDPDTKAWTRRIASHFSTVSQADPNFIGFGNPYVEDSGAAMFDMVNLYASETGGTNIKNAKINVDQVMQFFPDYEGSKTGIMKIKTQDVTITSYDKSTFIIGISGSGTYDENTKVIDFKVTFDEKNIGGSTRTFDYKMSAAALSLN
ncbi:hypothetical protein PBAL39_25595 [Pedobacter sp. BAL39]|uniref:hypothetical protein n=1 Tax=Pedobacter sp. BAL39 TaxID=391596 RepID=UPI0001559726|nr:hypothetical protein [Pedobacter sp. BAL39]EDM36705.1 hypothetical protein PBAL39_25595 [Pedobacter sp. BAL39]